jgi:hypothetical protein
MVGIVSLWERRPNAGPRGKPWHGYHEARLGELIEYIAIAIDRYRAGEVDAYHVDETIHHYHRAARELWNSAGPVVVEHIEMISHVIDRMTTDGETIN